MRKFTSRTLVAVVAALSLAWGVPVVAGASPGNSGNSSLSASSRNYRQELRAYREAVAQIQANFQAAVNAAHSAYQIALATATTSSQRSAALQTMEAAIIEAAAVRSAALVALGNPPSRSS